MFRAAAPIPRAVLAAPRWLWPTIETALAAAVTVGAAITVLRAWHAAAQLGIPWWARTLVLALPAGAAARFATAAPKALTRYRNWRDHTIDSLIDRLTPEEHDGGH